MSKFDYARTAATAVKLLNRFGTAATMRRQAGTQYDPATATVAPSWAEFACTLAAVDYAAKDIDGTLIQSSDRRLLVAPDIEQAPQTGDVFVLADGTQLTAIRVSTTSPSGVPVLFDVQARGQ